MKKNLIIFLFILNLYFTSTTISNAYDFAPEIGDTAPGFNLQGVNLTNKDKKEWSLKDFQGKWVVLYFYPKDFTTGCTLEAKGFTSLNNQFKKNNSEIIGISADNEDSHDSFCNEKSINYTLLSDPNGIVSDKYGSWIPPFSDRNTFLISPEGKIAYRWISVSPLNHAKEVLNILKSKN